MSGFKLLMKMKWNRFKKPNLETNMFDFQKKMTTTRNGDPGGKKFQHFICFYPQPHAN